MKVMGEEVQHRAIRMARGATNCATCTPRSAEFGVRSAEWEGTAIVMIFTQRSRHAGQAFVTSATDNGEPGDAFARAVGAGCRRYHLWIRTSTAGSGPGPAESQQLEVVKDAV
jgi:hypothetical protein